MGVILEAFDTEREVPVAVKMLKSDAFPSLAEGARFIREAETATCLSHQNLVRAFDFGVDERGAYYMVSEFLCGRSLEKLLLKRGVLPPAEALSYLFPIIGALAYAHRQGVVHRDVKPSNIFLAEAGGSQAIPKLLDFGIAASIDRTRLTDSNKSLGTIAYMAPEQILNRSIGPSIDIWAVGTVLYRCLAGREPFGEGSIEQQFYRITHDTVPPISQFSNQAERLDIRFCAAIERALRIPLDKRYASMASLARAWLVTAVNAGIEVPVSPDPVGLPHWNCWLEDAMRSGSETLQNGDRGGPDEFE